MTTTHKLTVNGIWTQFVEPLRNLEDFDTHGSLKGRRTRYVDSYGRLTDRGELAEAQKTGTLEYVVTSYATPVAWCINGEWTVTDQGFSVTTSKQLNRIRPAVAALSEL